MAVTEYKATSWSTNEPAFKDKLNQMTSNDQWLYEHMPKMRYKLDSGLTVEGGVRILAGYVRIGPRTNSRFAAAVVNFGAYFASGSRPIVVVGAPQAKPQREITLYIGGIGTQFPDNRGFELYATAGTSAKAITADLYVHYVAIGY